MKMGIFNLINSNIGINIIKNTNRRKYEKIYTKTN